MFRTAFKRRRCIVPSTGFFEWTHSGEAKKPMLILREDHQPFAMAGLWEVWYDKANEVHIDSFTILTTDANTLVSPIHNRMPVILNPENYDSWLDNEDVPSDEVVALMTAHSGKGFTTYAVSRIVNSPENDTPECVEPVR